MQHIKEKISSHLKEQVQKELADAKKAYQTTHSHATQGGLKAEGKYDTRKIEASYLAGAQKKRVDELEKEIELLSEMDLNLPNDSVSVGSLVSLEHNEMTKYYFISSTSGGSAIKIENEVFLVISAFSPLGSELIGLIPNDEFEVELPSGPRHYQLKQVF